MPRSTQAIRCLNAKKLTARLLGAEVEDDSVDQLIAVSSPRRTLSSSNFCSEVDNDTAARLSEAAPAQSPLAYCINYRKSIVVARAAGPRHSC